MKTENIKPGRGLASLASLATSTLETAKQAATEATDDRDAVRAALKANPTDRQFFKELGEVFGKVEFISGKLLEGEQDLERAAIFLTDKGGGPLPPKPTKGAFVSLGSTGGGAFQEIKNTDGIAEHLAERAAIQEYDGGLTREQAETEARRTLRAFEYRLTDNPAAWPYINKVENGS